MKFYTPKNKLLQKYIEGYYFISSDGEQAPLKYYTFPSNFFILSISHFAEVIVNDHQIIVRKSPTENLVTDFVSGYKKPIEVICEDWVPEITIYFKPLGINRFVQKPEQFFKTTIGLDLNPFDDWESVMKTLFAHKDRALQCEQLEAYWLSKLETKDFSALENIISDIESDFRIDEIAVKNNWSRQYLNRIFKKTVGKSPSEYRKIHRFRSAIMNQKDHKNLTELSLEGSFYDQSHLIKDFRELTNISPNSFFKNAKTDQENVWLFI